MQKTLITLLIILTLIITNFFTYISTTLSYQKLLLTTAQFIKLQDIYIQACETQSPVNPYREIQRHITKEMRKKPK